MKKESKTYGFIRGKTAAGGFTFAEILLVVLTLSVTAAALYSMIANGVNVWQRVTMDSALTDLWLFYERISGELNNSCLFKETPFAGRSDAVFFPACLPGGDAARRVIGTVEYAHDAAEKIIYRVQADYPQMCAGIDAGRRAVAVAVEDVRFTYRGYDPETRSFFWEEAWPPEKYPRQEAVFPLAIHISLVLRRNNCLERHMKTIAIPGGGLPDAHAEIFAEDG